MKVLAVVPCRNEEQFIEKCLRALFASELKQGVHLDVVVVDGLSTDQTRAIIQKLQQEFANLHLISNEHQLTPYAFNLGIRFDLSADYYTIVGAHLTVSKQYIQTAIDTLKAHPEVDCVGGNVENVYLNEEGKLISLAMGTALGMGLGNFRLRKISGYVDTVATPFYRRAIFDEIGFFDEDLVRNQDDDYNYRLTKTGRKIFLNAELSSKYYVRGSYKGLWRQFFQYGYWKVYVNKKHQTFTTIRQLAPPLFVVYLFTCLFVPLLFFTVSPVVAVWMVPFVCYLLLSVFMGIKLAQNFIDALKIVGIYWILHLSYGLGYLQGILHFLLLGKKPSDKQKRLSR